VQLLPQVPQSVVLVIRFWQPSVHCMSASAGHMHVPDTHIEFGMATVQLLPHVPQSVMLVARFWQPSVWPQSIGASGGQVHLLFTQDCPGSHALPQLPQLLALVLVSVHSEPQSVWAAPDELAGHSQFPLVQTSTAYGQALPHEPQLDMSELRSTQDSLHALCPPGQAQLPFVQVCPVKHPTPHDPQLCASVLTDVHSPLQSFCPPVHVGATTQLDSRLQSKPPGHAPSMHGNGASALRLLAHAKSAKSASAIRTRE
jgi:hypothetical protein